MPREEQMPPVPMTQNGYESLKAELEGLRSRRPHLVAELASARSQGDLSENFGYQDARRQLGMLDGRIQTIESTLRRAQVVTEGGAKADGAARGRVRIGSTVMVRDEFGESTYEIVGPTEGNIAKGKVSVASPLGGALLDREAGQRVSFTTPGGQREATILRVD
jgi:transcription elongation factor GreA